MTYQNLSVRSKNVSFDGSNIVIYFKHAMKKAESEKQLLCQFYTFPKYFAVDLK